LIKFGNLNKTKLEEYINKIIFSDKLLKVNDFDDIYRRLNSIFSNRRFVSNLGNVKVNWLDISSDKVISCVLEFIESFDEIAV